MERAALGLLFILTVSGTALANISNLRLCGDPECREPVSKGVTLLSYPSNDKHILSFPNNAEVLVYSKEAGSRLDLWGVEIKGKRGYVPKDYVREHKILKAKLEYEVPTEPYIKQHRDNSGKKSLVTEDSPQKKNAAEEEKSNDKQPVFNQESVAITAEDIEYSNIVEPDTKEEHHPEANDGNEPTNSEVNHVTSRENIADEKNRESKNSEHEIEESGEEKDVVEEESAAAAAAVEAEAAVVAAAAVEAEAAAAPEATTASSNEEAPNEDIVNQEGTADVKEQKNKEKDTSDSLDNTQATDLLQHSGVSEATETTTPWNEPDSLNTIQLESSSASDYTADPNSIQLESSSVEFEVIDGTTIYFNEDIEATPTLSEVQNTVVHLDSSVTEEQHVTVDPLSSLPQSSMEILEHDSTVSEEETIDPKESETLDPVSPTEVVDDVGNPSLIDSIPESPTEELSDKESPSGADLPSAVDLTKLILPPDAVSEEQDAAVSDEVKDNITEEQEPHVPSPTEAVSESSTESVLEPITETSTEVSTEEEKEEIDFGTPKSDTVLDGETTEQAIPAESGGFFASWFGSSETTDDDGDDDDDDSDADEETGVSHDSQVVESPIASEDSKVTDAAEINIDPSVDVVPSESVDVLVDESKDSSNAQDVDTVVLEIQDSNPSSVENKPDSTASSSSTDQYTNTPPHAPTDHTHIDQGGGSEDDTNETDEGEADLGPSTARPLFAEPEPTATTFSPHTNVDSDDMARLAEKNEERTAISDVDDEINSAEESLTQKFLKTSHNLLLSLAGAVQLPEGLAFGVEAEMAEPVMSSGMVVFLGVVAATIISIYLIHLLMVKSSRESPMLNALNKMERESRIISAENTSLHEQLLLARRELETVSSRVNQSSGDISELDSQLEVIKDEYASEKAQLEEKIVQLEHELEEATTNGEEMHKMLSEMLSSQKDTSSFQASVDYLQGMLDGQREKVETLNNDLALKTRLNEGLHSELAVARERVTKLDNQVQQLTQSLKEFSSAKEDMNIRLENESKMVKDLEEINKSLSKQTSDNDANISSMNSELQALQDTIIQLRDSVEIKDSELQVTKECLKQLRLTSDEDLAAPDDEKMSSLFDVIRVKAELQRVKKERNESKDQLHDAAMAQKNLEDTMSSIQVEVAGLRTQHDAAVHAKQEALSKLAVLTNYFEEKEAQLTKELESQEGLRVDAEGAAAAGASKIHNFGLELTTYKAQVESLRKELEEQENSYKAQIASYEQRVHDNWLQARAAERRFEEQRQENSQLRTRLTVMQKEKDETHIHSSISKPTPKRVDANGSMSSPGPVEGEVDRNHHDVDSPPVVSHPLHGPPPMLPPMMFPPGAPLPPVPPPHALPPGVPPHPGLPGVPPPHGLPPPPFLTGEAPFMGPPLPPLPGDRRLPPAGGMSSPPYRRSGSPSYGHHNDRYSPASEHSHFSERRYSPPPIRHRPGSPDLHRRNHSPDRRSDRTRSPDHRSDHMRSPDHRSNRRTPDRRLDRRSPDRHFPTRSPDGYSQHRSSPHHYFDHSDFNSDESRIHSSHRKGKKTSTPLNSSDRWKNDS